MATMRSGRATRCAFALVTGFSTLACGACNNAGEGAVSGGAIGALGGLAIGSLSGHAGEGAAIGAISGAVVGGIIGDQNKRASERQQEMRYSN